MRICVGNLKGGVAKSTTSVYLALGLGTSGQRVLLVDADGTNASALDWRANAADWPPNVEVVAVPRAEVILKQLPSQMQAYDHLVIDTGPENSPILRAALMICDQLVIPVAPSPLELRRLGPTFELAAEIDVTSPVTAQVLLVKIRANTRSAAEARAFLESLSLPVMEAVVHLREIYAMSWGTVPEPAEYEQVLAELREEVPV